MGFRGYKLFPFHILLLELKNPAHLITVIEKFCEHLGCHRQVTKVYANWLKRGKGSAHMKNVMDRRQLKNLLP